MYDIKNTFNSKIEFIVGHSTNKIQIKAFII